jgi:hypothetical protein
MHAVNPMRRLSEEEKRYLKYQIYSLRYDDPWITDKKAAKLLNRSMSTVNRYAKQAEEEGIIWNPTLGLAHPDRKVALLRFRDKMKAFNKLQEYMNVGYLCVSQGGWDVIALYDGEVDFLSIPGYEKTVMKGPRETIFTPKVSYTTWDRCFAEMETLLQKDPVESAIGCDLCYPQWDEEEWILYHYFRPNVRKKFSDLRKENPISWRKYEKWKQSLRTYCTIMMEYYPEGNKAYDSVILCFKTDYEQYIVDFFSHIPTTCFFYKIKEFVLVGIFIPQNYEQQMKLYEMISRLIDQKIITEYMDGNTIVYFVRTPKGGLILR